MIVYKFRKDSLLNQQLIIIGILEVESFRTQGRDFQTSDSYFSFNCGSPIIMFRVNYQTNTSVMSRVFLVQEKQRIKKF